MKNTIICVLLVMASAAAHATDNGDNGPADTAAKFVGQLYGVKPEQVEGTIIKREGWLASAVTSASGHPACTLDMAQAPKYVQAEYGWLIGGIACDKSSNTNQQQ
ncbi:TPA: hypothetical protein R1W95_000960 [Pseudomonas aeruginosa]|nr:hypothetical protein [Pseudomonas aeruginosa]